MDKNAAEYHKIIVYLDEIFSIPWNKYANLVWDTSYTKNILDNHVYGQQKVKVILCFSHSHKI
jgi:ATP-dependent Lon protease